MAPFRFFLKAGCKDRLRNATKADCHLSGLAKWKSTLKSAMAIGLVLAGSAVRSLHSSRWHI